MLSSSDARLVERDRDLPGLGVLLDDAAFLDLLRRALPAADIESARGTYVRYKRAVSCLVQYRVGAAGRQVTLYARTHGRRMGVKVDKAASCPATAGPLGPGIVTTSEPSLAVYVFPNDHELPVVRRFTDPAARRALVDRVLDGRSDLPDAPLTVLRHKPERRFVARLGGEDATGVVFKCYRGTEFSRALASARRATAAGTPSLVPLIGRSKRHRILAFPWIPGRPAHELLAAGADPADLGRRIGGALAELHGSSRCREPDPEVCDLRRRAREAGAALGMLSPELAGRAEELVRAIATMPDATGSRVRPLHGDFSIDQVVVRDERAVLVDLDRGGAGDPAIDLGCFLASLAATEIEAGSDRTRSAALGSGMLEAYREATDSGDERSLARCMAVALLRRAVEPFRSRHPEWSSVTSAYLDRVEELIGRAEATAR